MDAIIFICSSMTCFRCVVGLCAAKRRVFKAVQCQPSLFQARALPNGAFSGRCSVKRHVFRRPPLPR